MAAPTLVRRTLLHLLPRVATDVLGWGGQLCDGYGVSITTFEGHRHAKRITPVEVPVLVESIFDCPAASI